MQGTLYTSLESKLFPTGPWVGPSTGKQLAAPHTFQGFDSFFIIIYFWLAALGLCRGARALGAWASVVVARGLSSCGARA